MKITLHLDEEQSDIVIANLRRRADSLPKGSLGSPILHAVADDIEAQLRKSTPPEPKGLGAVVRDDDSNYFVRHTQGHIAPWIAAAPRDPDRPYRYWDGIRNPVIVQIGVEAGGDQ